MRKLLLMLCGAAMLVVMSSTTAFSLRSDAPQSSVSAGRIARVHARPTRLHPAHGRARAHHGKLRTTHRHAFPATKALSGAPTIPPATTIPTPPPTSPVPSTTIAPPATATPVAVPPKGEATAWGCDAALAYLKAYAAPGFQLVCPGYSFGHEAMTCVDNPPYCGAQQQVIVISDPCAAAYMNEASNSWVAMGESDAPIDPYGYC